MRELRKETETGTKEFYNIGVIERVRNERTPKGDGNWQKFGSMQKS